MPLRPDLPVDPDLAGDSPAPALSMANICLVVLGGTVGSLARGWVTELIPATRTFDTGIFVINVVGAFFLGFLISLLVAPASPRHLRWKLLLGTGFAGGFTTYSAFVLSVVGLLMGGWVWQALGYGLATVVLGGLGTYAGIISGSKVAGKTSRVTGP